MAPSLPSPPHPTHPPTHLQSVSINLSPNTTGQVAMSLMVNTPQVGGWRRSIMAWLGGEGDQQS